MKNSFWRICGAMWAFALVSLAQGQIEIAVLNDTEKLPAGKWPGGATPAEIGLEAAGNEVVAFQLLLRAKGNEAGLDVVCGDLAKSGGAKIAAENVEIFLARYVMAMDASYSWGPSGGSGALPWKALAWPDALVPLRDPYDAKHPGVAAPFTLEPTKLATQAVWVDVLVPQGTKAGEYAGKISLVQQGKVVWSLALKISVLPFALPNETHTDAFGELYRETGLMFDTGVKFRENPEKEWAISKKYAQLAHAHRIVAVQRGGEGPMPTAAGNKPATGLRDAWTADWSRYTKYVDSVLNGKLFTTAGSYRGVCVGTGPSFYPAPFPEAFYGSNGLLKQTAKSGGKLDAGLVATITSNTTQWQNEVAHAKWPGSLRWLAYIFDEADGGHDAGANTPAGQATRQQIYGAAGAVAEALKGSATPAVRLLWTSHAPAAQVPAGLDLWRCPAADALDPGYFTGNKSQGDLWFYHSGRPFIGNHSINQTGVDLRMWALACQRYHSAGVSGFFIWSLMCFSTPFNDARNPYDKPVYKTEETRWGNGVMIYPGSRLKQSGYVKDIAGPVASMRLKALRRGLQDAEYCWLAREKGKGAEVDALLLKLIPRAFGDAKPGEKATWSESPAEYSAFRTNIAKLIKE